MGGATVNKFDEVMTVVVWGTYDLGKPRVRILLSGLQAAGVNVIPCHVDVWQGIEDKSQVRGLWRKFFLFIHWVFAYPRLIAKYLFLPKHSAVLVPYLGHFDVIVLWIFAKIRGAPIVWDVFLSLYNTAVEDRRLVSPSGIVARLIYGIEALACFLSDEVFLDTKAHAEYFRKKYNSHVSTVSSIQVGVELDAFPVCGPVDTSKAERLVVFYGQFIPLHGVETIVRAAALMRDCPVNWVLIGSGQESKKIASLLHELNLPRVTSIDWVNYLELRSWIDRADVCLGVFSKSIKAGMVIPNKIFQIVASGRPLITRESDAIRELFPTTRKGVYLVPPEDASALADAVMAACDDKLPGDLFSDIRESISPYSIGLALRALVLDVVARKKRVSDDN